MIKGVGVDIVEIKRIDFKIIDRVLSNEEKELFFNMSQIRKREFLAGRFAIKEALFKAGIHESFSILNVKYDENNSIYLENYPNVKISISHEKEYAVGFALVED